MPPGKVKRPAAIRKPRRKSITTFNDRSPMPIVDDEIVTTSTDASVLRKGAPAAVVMFGLAVMAISAIFLPRTWTANPVNTVKPETTTKPETTKPETTEPATTKAAISEYTPTNASKTAMVVLAVGIVMSTAFYFEINNQGSIARLMAFAVFMFCCVALYNYVVSNSDTIQQDAYRWVVAGLSIFMLIGSLFAGIVFHIGTTLLMMAGSMMLSAAYFMLAKGADFVDTNAAMLSRLGLIVFLSMAAYWKFGGVGAFVMAFCAASLLSISMPMDEAPAAVTEPGDSTNTSAALKPLSLADSFFDALSSLPLLVLIVAFPMILIESDPEMTPSLVFTLLSVTAITYVVQNGYFWNMTFLRPSSSLPAK